MSEKETPKTPDEVVAQEEEQGFSGIEVDPTPNEAYTVEGVTSGQPTPETDADAKAAADKRAAEVARGATGEGGATPPPTGAPAGPPRTPPPPKPKTDE